MLDFNYKKRGLTMIKTKIFNSNKELSKKQRQTIKVIDLLESDFPRTFNFKKPKILKIGIHNDIYEHYKKVGNEQGMTRIKRALKYYTSRKQYITIIRRNARRYDLSGKQVSSVTLSEGMAARDRFEETFIRK